MFVSMVESALQGSSNSLFAFIFCNLIILVILLGSKFSSSNSKTQDVFPGPHRYGNAKPVEIGGVEWRPYQIECATRPEKQAEGKLASVQVSEVCNIEINGKEEEEYKGCECEQEDEDGEYEAEAEAEDKEEGDNVDDDELRRRIDDFIAKVNREREEENLRIDSLS